MLLNGGIANLWWLAESMVFRALLATWLGNLLSIWDLQC